MKTLANCRQHSSTAQLSKFHSCSQMPSMFRDSKIRGLGAKFFQIFSQNSLITFIKFSSYLNWLNGIIRSNETLFFRKKDRAMHMVIDPKAKYKLKWNVPLNDVDIVEYGPGVNILTSSYRTTISHSNEGRFSIKSSKWFEHRSKLKKLV